MSVQSDLPEQRGPLVPQYRPALLGKPTVLPVAVDAPKPLPERASATAICSAVGGLLRMLTPAERTRVRTWLDSEFGPHWADENGWGAD